MTGSMLTVANDFTTGRGEVTLTSDLPFSDFLDPFEVTEIVSSRTFLNGEWGAQSRLRGFTKGVNKMVVPVDISQFRIMVITNVEPGTHIGLHKHDDEPIFRYVSHGSFHLNGERYEAGEWVLVPISYPYEISTEEGYVTVAGYGCACGSDGSGDGEGTDGGSGGGGNGN